MITLHGSYPVRITIWHCKNHPEPIVYKPPALRAFTYEGFTYGIDIMVAVGLLRWGLNLERKTIRALFKRRDIPISTGTVSHLSEDFLVLFKILHEKHYPAMRKIFERNGGAVLHIDCTEETEGKVVLTVKEGTTGITVMAELLPGEKMEHIVPILEDYRRHFDPPVAVVRDMGDAIKKSVEKVFPGVPHQICHYHFLLNLGKKVMATLHSSLKDKVAKKKLVPRLNALRRDVHDTLCSIGKPDAGPCIKTGERYWVHLAIDDITDGLRTRCKPPFLLPCLEGVGRCRKVSGQAKRIISNNVSHNRYVKEVMALDDILKSVIKDEGILREYSKLKRVNGWIDEVRESMRLSREFCQDTHPLDEKKMDTIKKDIQKTLAWIEKQGIEIGGDYTVLADKIIKDFTRHWDELFVSVKKVSGKVPRIRRDNNIEERGHRLCRMQIRKRTGNGRTTRDMEKFGSLMAIFSNLFNETYMGDMLTTVDDLVAEFSRIPYGEVRERKKKAKRERSYPRLPVSPKQREPKLKEFIEILEEDPTDITIRIQTWLEGLA